MFLSEVHRNKIRIGIRLECEVDYNRIACGTGVFLRFLKDLNLADKHSEYGFLFLQYLVKSFDDDDMLTETGTGDVVRKIQFCFVRFLVYQGEVFLADTNTHFFILQ